MDNSSRGARKYKIHGHHFLSCQCALLDNPHVCQSQWTKLAGAHILT